MRPQHFVIAVRAVFIEGRREDLAPFKFDQHHLAAAGAQQLVTQSGRQTTEDTSPQQEVAQVDRQLVEHVAGEVLAHEARAQTEFAQDPTPLPRGLSRRGQVEQLQSRGPPFGAARQLGEFIRRQVLAVDIAEQPLDFPRAEAKIVSADLEEGARDAQSREIEAGKAAGRGQHVETRRQVLEQSFECAFRFRAP